MEKKSTQPTHTPDTEEAKKPVKPTSKTTPIKKEPKTTFTIDDIKNSRKVRKTMSIRTEVSALLERMHINTLTLDGFDFTKEVENLIIEKAAKQGVLDLSHQNVSETEKLLQIKGQIEGSIDHLATYLNNYVGNIRTQIFALQDQVNTAIHNPTTTTHNPNISAGNMDLNYDKRIAASV